MNKLLEKLKKLIHEQISLENVIRFKNFTSEPPFKRTGSTTCLAGEKDKKKIEKRLNEIINKIIEIFKEVKKGCGIRTYVSKLPWMFSKVKCGTKSNNKFHRPVNGKILCDDCKKVIEICEKLFNGELY